MIRHSLSIHDGYPVTAIHTPVGWVFSIRHDDDGTMLNIRNETYLFNDQLVLLSNQHQFMAFVTTTGKTTCRINREYLTLDGTTGDFEDGIQWDEGEPNYELITLTKKDLRSHTLAVSSLLLGVRRQGIIVVSNDTHVVLNPIPDENLLAAFASPNTILVATDRSIALIDNPLV